MKVLDNKQIEEKLKDGYEQLTPPFTEELRGRVENEKGQVVVMQEKKAKKSQRRNRGKRSGSACLQSW